MKTLQSILASALAHIIPKQPVHDLVKLQLSPAQRQMMDVLDIQEIRLDYRSKDRAVIQHSTWSSGEKDDYLPRVLADLPHEVLVITRNAGVVQMRGGPAYQGMSAIRFEDIVSHLLANTRDSIGFVDSMQRSQAANTAAA